jgi:DNA-binding transcriptional ArsR family regulator
MDSLLSTAARALAAGDPLGALKYIALRDDPSAVALRGIAMAQLGDFGHARKLLARAARTFGPSEAVDRARCVTAQADVALASRDVATAGTELERAIEVLEAHDDAHNALFARLVRIRRFVLLGEVKRARQELAKLRLDGSPARLVAVAQLVAADVATRELRSRDARSALEQASRAALASRVPSLLREVENAQHNLDAPVARLRIDGVERLVTLDEVEKLLGAGELVVDACRRQVRLGDVVISLTSRPVLFAIVATLADGAGSEATRAELIWQAFATRRPNDSHRARLRVEMGRLRKTLASIAAVEATSDGFALRPHGGTRVLLLLPAAPGEGSALLALLGGGEAWSTSALAAALGKSQRTVQRALGTLEEGGQVRAIGDGRARRWVAPPTTGFATTLLLVTRETLG